MKKCFLLLLITTTLFAQEKIEKKKFFDVLWGEPVKDNISFMPLAHHTRILKNKDFFGIYYSSVSYSSFELAAFNNSFSDFTLGLFYKREIPVWKRLSVSYGAGIIYGYDGNLEQVKGLPPGLKNFFFGGAISPAVGGRINVKITDKITATALLVPLVNAYGLTYYF